MGSSQRSSPASHAGTAGPSRVISDKCTDITTQPTDHTRRYFWPLRRWKDHRTVPSRNELVRRTIEPQLVSLTRSSLRHPPPSGLRQRIADIESPRPAHPGEFHPAQPFGAQPAPVASRSSIGDRPRIPADSRGRIVKGPKQSTVSAYQPLLLEWVAVVRVAVDFILPFR